MTGIFIHGTWKEYYKLNNYVERQCQVNSVTINENTRKHRFYGLWNATVIDENNRAHVIIEEVLPTREEAQQYQVLFYSSSRPRLITSVVS